MTNKIRSILERYADYTTEQSSKFGSDDYFTVAQAESALKTHLKSLIPKAERIDEILRDFFCEPDVIGYGVTKTILDDIERNIDNG